MKRLYFVVAAALLVVAVFAVAPFGQATSVVNKIVPMAKNSDRVDGIHAGRTAQAGRLVTLGADGKFTSAVIPQAGTSIVTGPTVVLDPLGGANPVNSSAAACPAGSAPVGGGWDFDTNNNTAGPLFATVATSRAFGSQWAVIMVSNTSYTAQQFRAFALCSQGAQVPRSLSSTRGALAAEVAQLRAAVEATTH